MPKSDPTLKADLHQIDSVQCVTTEELPPDFYHEPPEGYSYWVEPFKRNVLAIWLQHTDHFNYTNDPVHTIWGFYNTKKREYYAPVNSKKCGDAVDISDTRPYTAMQLKLNPLEYALYSSGR